MSFAEHVHRAVGRRGDPVAPSSALRRFAAALLGAAACAAAPAHAQFALGASPPRFELTAAPGTTLREVLQLSTDSARPTSYTVRTADWRLEPDGSVTFFDELQAGSCRPWVAIERRQVLVTAARPYRYRFEVAVPPDTPPQECRFALLLEAEAGQSTVPVSARMGVIVYVGVGGVAPRLEVVGWTVGQANGLKVPMVRVRNAGTAHGRLDGFLTGTDAQGRALELTPASPPVLPGETREVALVPALAGAPAVQVEVLFPVTVRGKLEWGRGGSMAVDQRVTP